MDECGGWRAGGVDLLSIKKKINKKREKEREREMIFVCFFDGASHGGGIHLSVEL